MYIFIIFARTIRSTTTIVVISNDIICNDISRGKYFPFSDDKWWQKEFVFLILVCGRYY